MCHLIRRQCWSICAASACPPAKDMLAPANAPPSCSLAPRRRLLGLLSDLDCPFLLRLLRSRFDGLTLQLQPGASVNVSCAAAATQLLLQPPPLVAFPKSYRSLQLLLRWFRRPGEKSIGWEAQERSGMCGAWLGLGGRRDPPPPHPHNKEEDESSNTHGSKPGPA